MISDETWEKIREFHLPLKIVAHKMEKFQRADLTLSDVFGEWFELKENLKEMPQTTFIENLLKGIMEREKSILTNTLMLTSVFLDPRLNILLKPSRNSIAISLLKDLYNKLHEKTPSSSPSTTINVEPEASSSDSQESQCSALENYLKSIENSNRLMSESQTILRLEAEINCFKKLERLPVNNSIHEFWQKSRKLFPLLHEIACIIMAVPPSEVSVERNFSKLNFTLNRFRTNLKDSEVENFLFLSLNKDLFGLV